LELNIQRLALGYQDFVDFTPRLSLCSVVGVKIALFVKGSKNSNILFRATFGKVLDSRLENENINDPEMIL